MGVDFDKLRELAESSLYEALINLKETLNKDSEVLTNQGWDEEEHREWAEKMDPKRERKALALNLEKISITYPPFPKVAKNSLFLNLQRESSSLSKILSNKKETFCDLVEELAADEPWPNIEDIIRFTPSPQHPDPHPEPQSHLFEDQGSD